MIKYTHICKYGTFKVGKRAHKTGFCRKCRPIKGGQPKKVWMINGVEITTKHHVYNLRYGMMSRCYNAKPSEYKHYQGKGIKVCDEWINNPESFFLWCLNNGCKEGLVIDRKDSDGHYTPENCQFITPSDNSKKNPKKLGINHHMCTTTEEQVFKIKELLALKRFTYIEIAKQCGVSRDVVSDISRGKTWRHL